MLTVAALLLPLIYSVTDWLGFADYVLPVWIGWIGIFLLAVSLAIFMKAHTDLAENWSRSLELYVSHRLITSGIYRHIRHPMYLSQLLWAAAQIILIENWIAGFSSIVLFWPFYFLRAVPEEKMMHEKFGKKYKEYKAATGGLIPKLK